MIDVKICGITHLEDALCAAENGAQAVGFIFYSPSPRYIDPHKAGEIIDRLPAHLVKVGIFVNEHEDKINRIFEDCRLDMLQLHGDETPAFCRQFPARRLIKALEIKSEGDLNRVDDYDVAAVLADTRHAGLYGGTGMPANWALARKVSKPLILSGGLNETNIADALLMVKPDALDINSGVEERPGKKDAGKIARIMEIIRQMTSGGKSPQIFVRREEK